MKHLFDISEISYLVKGVRFKELVEILVNFKYKDKYFNYIINISIKDKAKDSYYIKEAKKIFENDLNNGKVKKYVNKQLYHKQKYIIFGVFISLIVVFISLFTWKMLEPKNPSPIPTSYCSFNMKLEGCLVDKKEEISINKIEVGSELKYHIDLIDKSFILPGVPKIDIVGIESPKINEDYYYDYKSGEFSITLKANTTVTIIAVGQYEAEIKHPDGTSEKSVYLINAMKKAGKEDEVILLRDIWPETTLRVLQDLEGSKLNGNGYSIDCQLIKDNESGLIVGDETHSANGFILTNISFIGNGNKAALEIYDGLVELNNCYISSYFSNGIIFNGDSGANINRSNFKMINEGKDLLINNLDSINPINITNSNVSYISFGCDEELVSSYKLNIGNNSVVDFLSSKQSVYGSINNYINIAGGLLKQKGYIATNSEGEELGYLITPKSSNHSDFYILNANGLINSNKYFISHTEYIDFYLLKDIDCSKAEAWKSLTIYENFASTMNVFEGNDHYIKNIKIVNNPRTEFLNCCGLFDQVEEPLTIRNIYFINPIVESTNPHVGVIIGRDVLRKDRGNIVIDNVHINGAIIKGKKKLGGLVGLVCTEDTSPAQLIIKDCSVNNLTCYESANDDIYVGGFVGWVNTQEGEELLLEGQSKIEGDLIVHHNISQIDSDYGGLICLTEHYVEKNSDPNVIINVSENKWQRIKDTY